MSVGINPTIYDKPKNTGYAVVHPETFGQLGHVNWTRFGWYFITAVQSHGNSRKPRPTAHQAIPRWAQKLGAKLV